MDSIRLSVLWSILLLIAVFGPAVGSLVVALRRSPGMTSGRVLAISCGGATLSALTLAAISGSRPSGVVGHVALLDLHIDRVSALLVALIVSTGLVVSSFARRNLDLDPRAGRFFTLVGVMVSGCALVVVPGHPAGLIGGWLASSWALVGLVGHRADLPIARQAQRRIIRALAVGDGALLVAIVIAVAVAGRHVTSDVPAALEELRSTRYAGLRAVDIVAVLLVIAGASRSALVPFHHWLIATLAAPTPVSALVHAGFVSGAGLLFIRFAALLSDSGAALWLAFAVAVATVVVATGAGWARPDVKGRLVWSTVGQMAFMVLQCSVGAFSSAAFHIVGHGMYKASMFLGAGNGMTSGLRSWRRPSSLRLAPRGPRLAVAVVVASAAVASAFLVFSPDLPDAGVALVVCFAWLTVAHGVWGWLTRGPLPGARAVLVATVGGFGAAFAYAAGLHLVERFVAPSFSGLTASPVGLPAVLITLGVVVVAVVLGGALPRSLGGGLRTGLAVRWTRVAHPRLAGGARFAAVEPTSVTANVIANATRTASAVAGGVTASRLSQIRADVARAGTIVAPLWPLTSFVSVNPLGGLEHLGFDSAATLARERLGARTHLSLEEFRVDHRRGATTTDDLRHAIATRFIEVCSRPDALIGGRSVDAATIIELDMLHGPECAARPAAVTMLGRSEGPCGPIGTLIDETICLSAARVATATALAATDESFGRAWRRDAVEVSSIGSRLTATALAWLRDLDDDPAAIIDAALGTLGVGDEVRLAEMQGHLARLHGWAGYAKWRTDWASADERRCVISLIDLVAARCALEAACILSSGPSGAPNVPSRPDGELHGELDDVLDSELLDERIDAVRSALGADRGGFEERALIGDVVSRVPAFARNEAWLDAQERHVDRRFLTLLDRLDPGAAVQTPDAQLVFCIDVRSEGLRRHLEALGPYETYGFAGFFGVALNVQRLGWDHHEPRCPVLVAPSVRAVERVRPAAADDGRSSPEAVVGRDRFTAGLAAVHGRTKYGLGAPFAMAEAAGWIAGPVAAARTLLPMRTAPRRPSGTVMRLDDDELTGPDVDQRVYLAEAVLTTMGLTSRFAPLVVLCGHASHNVNNPHATALDCGACAGASGQDSARAVADMLNQRDVRDGLAQRGIRIPSTTWFVGAVHDTVSDHVEILDPTEIPTRHAQRHAQLEEHLAVAGLRQSADRARHLPGPARNVRRRGSDWAQVRPEWGLAGNAAFIIGPRSMTAGLDLGGRAFLHTYDADDDPSGRVLETIMTAPLVVGHWISAQYYFSTVDPEVFGAGDKLLHNIVGDVGVVTGDGGDIRVGLPLQSTHCGTRRHHQPVRMLAIVQAPLERIETIIDANPILKTLIDGSWIRLAGRSHPHEPWSERTAHGTWITAHRPLDTELRLETS